jgi:hypothetical protein
MQCCEMHRDLVEAQISSLKVKIVLSSFNVASEKSQGPAECSAHGLCSTQL